VPTPAGEGRGSARAERPAAPPEPARPRSRPPPFAACAPYPPFFLRRTGTGVLTRRYCRPVTLLREIFTGIGTLLRGFGMILRRPKLFLLGALPPLLTSVLFLVVLIALLARIDDLTAWMTPFADGWADGWTTALRVALGIVLVAASVLLMVIGFTTVTLALGSPLYDMIAEEVEEELGDAPEPLDEPLLTSVMRALRISLALILISAAAAVPLFVAGFIPVVGQTVVPVVSALVGGWLLGAELIGSAFERRGLLRL